MTTDRIVKQILLRASRARVWRALSDSKEFGYWFGMRFDGPFVEGAIMRGVIVPTQVDPEVAKGQKKYDGVPFELQIARIEPERLFSYRWHPGAIDPKIDYGKEPTTLVAFELEETVDGILLTVTESGFDQIPLERRAHVFRDNERGWGGVMGLIEKYLDHAR